MISTELENQNHIPWWNYFDYVPVVSNISGTVRTVFGTAEAVIGVVAIPFQLLSRAAGRRHTFILVDGVANIVRGAIAEAPILGNVGLYLYDHMPSFKKDFQRATGLLFP